MGRDPKATKQSKAAEQASHALRTYVLAQGMPSDGLLTEASSWGDITLATQFLLTRTDGWLRITPHDDGERVYFKWKWTAGPYINHYVMVVYPYFQCGNALLRLAMKVDSVDRGEQAPVKDHYFKG